MPQKNGEGREKAKASGGIQTPDDTKPVESANDVVVVVQVEDEVLSHDGQADDADVGAEKHRRPNHNVERENVNRQQNLE